MKITINKTRLKIAVLKWHLGLPGANELMLCVCAGIRPEKLVQFEEDCWRLMKTCWAGDPANRPLLGIVEPQLHRILERHRKAASRPRSPRRGEKDKSKTGVEEDEFWWLGPQDETLLFDLAVGELLWLVLMLCIRHGICWLRHKIGRLAGWDEMGHYSLVYWEISKKNISATNIISIQWNCTVIGA